MGEAKRRRDERAGLVWHHTSILRTNLIWMSGIIDLEGRSKGALHPAFGQIHTDAAMRRPMQDFPALAWFTSDFNVPKCLLTFDAYVTRKDTGAVERITLSPEEVAAFSMNRIAIGFPAADIGVRRWPDHPGYSTGEGADLNETARDLGDDPDTWWVSDEPVDVLKSTEIRGGRSLDSVKMESMGDYLRDVHRMVATCRAIPGTMIPPAWYGSAFHKALIAAGKDYRG